MRMFIRILAGIATGSVLLVVGGWLGLQVKATSFPVVALGASLDIVPLPSDLPAPVLAFGRALFGDSIPEIQSAIVLGRASLAPTGLPMPTRFRFYYDIPRNSYYHDIQATWFSLPFMRIRERNLAGHAILDLGVLGRVEDAPHTNRAAVQGYWGEALAWVPSVVLIDKRVRWELVDATTARLYLPGLDDEEAFTVRFDETTGLMTEFETMRYQDETQLARKRWRNSILEWGVVDGVRVPVRSQTQWNDDAPWAIWNVEQVVFNVDVSARMAEFSGDIR